MSTTGTHRCQFYCLSKDRRLSQRIAENCKKLSFSSSNVDLESWTTQALPRFGCLVADSLFLELPQEDPIRVEWGNSANRVLLMVVKKGDVSGAVTAIRAGAVNVLEQPLNEKLLRTNLQVAADLEASLNRHRVRSARLVKAIEQLTERERTILDLLIAGETNKAISQTLRLSLRTIESDRAQIMIRLNVSTFSQLVATVTAERDRLPFEKSRRFGELLLKNSMP